MKRALDNGTTNCLKKLQNDNSRNMPKEILNEPCDIFPILDLPNDEFIVFLEYLPLEDKKNLKLVSRAFERRMLDLDIESRSWTVNFDLTNFEEQKVYLAQAKLRHMLNGTLHKISLSVDVDDFNDSFFSMLLAETVISQWKNNIVHLGMYVYGLEFYLLDPDFRIDNLKSLSVAAVINNEMAEKYATEESTAEKRIENIVSNLIDKHKETLEELCLVDINLTVDSNLKIHKFTADGTDPTTIVSVLQASQKTVRDVVLKFVNDESDVNNDELEGTHLQVKKLTLSKVPANFITSVLKSTMNSLENLDVNDINDLVFDPGTIKFTKLSEICACKSTGITVAKLIKAAKDSLRYVALDGIRDVEEFELGSIRLNILESFSIQRILKEEEWLLLKERILSCSRKVVLSIEMRNKRIWILSLNEVIRRKHFSI